MTKEDTGPNLEGTGPYRVLTQLITTEGVVNEGDIIKIKGERGSFKFIKYVFNPNNDKEWIDCINVRKDGFRSFRPNKVIVQKQPKSQADKV